MSYQVLARKWRPATFEQMVGQSHVLHALTNALTQQRLHHAYLFSGTRGVGKTSLARLFAKGLNCEQGVTATPCGQCSACVEIAEGRFVDLIEVDAASRTKVDDTRELLDNVQYRPSRGRYKVYLIDEVHMLSRSSFNALLKTLEEPPEHVKFLLATTDPQRLPVTVLSRCLQFNLKSLTQEEITTQLEHILTQEQLSYENTALSLLAKAANGSMRDALSLTDQAIAFGAGQVKLELVQTMLGSIDEKHVIALLEALTKADIMNLMQVSAKVLSFGAEPEEVLRSLLELLHQITLTQFAPAAAQMSLYSEQISAFAQQLSAEQVQLYYQLLLTGRKDLPHAPDPKSGLEMALLRAVTFVPEKPVTRWAVDSQATIQIPDVNPEVNPEANSVPNAAAPAEKKTVESVTPRSKPALTGLSSQANEAEANQQQAEALQDEKEQAVDEPLDSLNSEMAVIMSQAESQGFEQALPELISELSSEAHTALNQQQEQESSESSSPELDISHTDSVASASNQVGVASDKLALEANTVEGTEAESSPAIEASIKQQPVASNYSDDNFNDHSGSHSGTISDDSSNSGDYQQHSYANDADNELASYADYAGAYGDAFAATDQDDYGFGQETSYQPNQTPAHQQVSAPEQAEALSNTSQSSTIDAGDDLLDAVLAARATLLEGLGEDEPKEGASKKSLEVRKPFTPPVRKEPVNTSDDIESSEPLSNKSEASATAPKQIDNAETEQEIIDRPPWEEPHEQDPCARFDSESDSESDSETLVDSKATANVSAEQADIDSEQPQSVSGSSPVQDIELNLPALPSGELTGNDVDLKWYRFMSELEVGGRVRQLAVNSVCHQFEQPLSLLLKPDQKHLAADIAIKQLEEAMTETLGEACSVSVTVGVDAQRETPLEVRRRFHKEILTQAHHDLMTDHNVRWLTQNMGAQMTPDSLTYTPELLVQKGKLIELIDIANFKRLTES
ncbi:DNA polymerase III subunit gamma/tau [Shewanella sairae]|uniref:DNA-directed DNA polymerase n=1 Tax=Shewanella sairae TaxID=190310 RepID=A0ABQ4PPN9_9GAMM|nr:DNA polymerase III subunit gamma/tau [Shewanella sairae]MCL1130373.1 DNA polymerase III subunit gamma/tau [Shewanella sairae]GIU50616.1 DNA polymerase III subunit gamma/tau [Shewanella sairae]